MLVLEFLGGWFLLSCVTAPLIGRFIATHASIVEDAAFQTGEPQLQPVQSY